MEKVVPIRLESNIDEIIGKVERLNCVLREANILMNELEGMQIEIELGGANENGNSRAESGD